MANCATKIYYYKRDFKPYNNCFGSLHIVLQYDIMCTSTNEKVEENHTMLAVWFSFYIKTIGFIYDSIVLRLKKIIGTFENGNTSTSEVA